MQTEIVETLTSDDGQVVVNMHRDEGGNVTRVVTYNVRTGVLTDTDEG